MLLRFSYENRQFQKSFIRQIEFFRVTLYFMSLLLETTAMSIAILSFKLPHASDVDITRFAEVG